MYGKCSISEPYNNKNLAGNKIKKNAEYGIWKDEVKYIVKLGNLLVECFNFQMPRSL